MPWLAFRALKLATGWVLGAVPTVLTWAVVP